MKIKLFLGAGLLMVFFVLVFVLAMRASRPKNLAEIQQSHKPENTVIAGYASRVISQERDSVLFMLVDEETGDSIQALVAKPSFPVEAVAGLTVVGKYYPDKHLIVGKAQPKCPSKLGR